MKQISGPPLENYGCARDFRGALWRADEATNAGRGLEICEGKRMSSIYKLSNFVPGSPQYTK